MIVCLFFCWGHTKLLNILQFIIYNYLKMTKDAMDEKETYRKCLNTICLDVSILHIKLFLLLAEERNFSRVCRPDKT